MVQIRNNEPPTPGQEEKNRIAEGGSQSAQERFRGVGDEPAEDFQEKKRHASKRKDLAFDFRREKP